MALISTPGYLSGAAWIETTSGLSKECSPVGLQMCLRSRHLGVELRRILRRPRRPPDAERE